ncbi:MAG: hypothetical protein H7328_08440 [Bdellovibrio sp.]|nr:hypothetical protein [Bdellovibrio sp.]
MVVINKKLFFILFLSFHGHFLQAADSASYELMGKHALEKYEAQGRWGEMMAQCELYHPRYYDPRSADHEAFNQCKQRMMDEGKALNTKQRSEGCREIDCDEIKAP